MGNRITLRNFPGEVVFCGELATDGKLIENRRGVLLKHELTEKLWWRVHHISANKLKIKD